MQGGDPTPPSSVIGPTARCPTLHVTRYYYYTRYTLLYYAMAMGRRSFLFSRISLRHNDALNARIGIGHGHH